jgi:hypothetical protein
MIDSKQPMVHIELYREGGRYVESAGERKKKRRKRKGGNTIANEQPSTLGVPNFKKKSRVTRVHRGNYKAFY